MKHQGSRLQILKCSFFIVPFLSVLLVGCGGNEKPETVLVSGLVTLDGKPLSKGTVTFQSKSRGEGTLNRPAIGQIDENGRVQLSTFEEGDGVLPGNYTVVITAFENDPSVEEYAAGAQRKSLIPEKYSNPLTSGLEAVVTEGENEFTFDLHQKK
ncbi:hypothetical protein V202x_45600 [Gimesia aquarii]|uniref:Nickel uptake substrate-specific transmembrane region n=1 Tax=Gimesia aquarii TaxID=2527964 RepID=A0A517X0W8_9PLAN|nr:hypothetical protein V202x_45600 [Gimesia aquarii]